MADEKDVLFQVLDGVATITLNRPKAFNALNESLGRQLYDALLECKQTDTIRAVVITGAGRAFCAGGDVKSFAEHAYDIDSHIMRLTNLIHSSISLMVHMNKPTICAVNGMAAGGGMSLALAGDLIFATESAKFTMAYTHIGASPDGSSTFTLPRLVGVKKALELVLLNPVLSAQEALAWGLVNQVFPDDRFVEEVLNRATRLAHGPTIAYGEAKALLYNSTQETLETQMQLEALSLARCGRTKDFKEGVLAFIEKRPAHFVGQ